jgi:hypothetical protein
MRNIHGLDFDSLLSVLLDLFEYVLLAEEVFFMGFQYFIILLLAYQGSWTVNDHIFASQT